MDKNEIFNIIKRSIMEIVPDIDEKDICPEISMKDLGANSVDRMDIIIQSMKELEIKVPMVEFGNLKNIQGVVDLLYEKKLTFGK
ncbi:MAG TPA: acyl carrier protein [Bacillota bacterium]|nr:acyl carrier protein [Bacillota bacterium]